MKLIWFVVLMLYFFLIACSFSGNKQYGEKKQNRDLLKEMVQESNNLNNNNFYRTKSKYNNSSKKLYKNTSSSFQVKRKIKDARNQYLKILKEYQQNSLSNLQEEVKKMLIFNSESNYVDNSLYLAGKLALKEGQYGEALKYFNKLIKDYPYGNKVNSAILAKGFTYKRMNLDFLANKMFKKVLNEYFDSPEAKIALIELKLLNRK